jgi:hypothetical protein
MFCGLCNRASTTKPTKPPAKSNHARLNDLLVLEALIGLLHTVACSPVKSTWMTAIQAGNYSMWPGLKYTTTTKYYPNSGATIKGYLMQTRQGV